MPCAADPACAPLCEQHEAPWPWSTIQYTFYDARNVPCQLVQDSSQQHT